MHGCSWKERRRGSLKSSTLGKRERRGWSGWRDGVCALLWEKLPLIATNTAKPSAPPSPSDSPDLSPVDLGSPSTITNSPCHTPQLDPCLERLRVFGEGQEKKEGSMCGLCHGVCHLLPHNTLGIVCVCVCVWGRAKRGGSWGTHPVRMLCYYLSSGEYESQGTVSGKEKDKCWDRGRERRGMNGRGGRRGGEGMGGLNSVQVSGEQTHVGTGALLVPAAQDTSCPWERRGQSTQTKDSDLTKWVVNDRPAPNKIIWSQTREEEHSGTV